MLHRGKKYIPTLYGFGYFQHMIYSRSIKLFSQSYTVSLTIHLSIYLTPLSLPVLLPHFGKKLKYIYFSQNKKAFRTTYYNLNIRNKNTIKIYI